jgi:hypothetical protein
MTVKMGVAALPLTGSAACPMSVIRRAGFGWPSGRAGAVPWSGRSGRGGGRAAGGGEQGLPFVVAVPGFGQVQRDVAVAVPGGAGGDVDEVAADGGAAGLAVGQAGQGPGGAQQVMRDGGAGQPGRVRRETSRTFSELRCLYPVVWFAGQRSGVGLPGRMPGDAGMPSWTVMA